MTVSCLTMMRTMTGTAVRPKVKRLTRGVPAVLGLLSTGLVAWMASSAPAIAQSAASDDITRVTVGAFAAPGSPWNKHWQMFKQNAESRSNGEIAVKLLINGEAGGESATMTNIRRNRMQFGGFTLAGGAPVLPELDVLLIPFFFDDRAELDFVMDEFLMPKFRELFAKKNLYLVQWVEVGWTNIYGKGPIRLPKDANDRRMRAQAAIAAQEFMGSIGAEMIQMEFADVIPSLQTGLIYGGETNTILYGLTGLLEEAPHMTMTRHSYDTGIVVANLSWLNSLPADQQEIIKTAFVSSDEARADVRVVADALEAVIEKKGGFRYELTADERAIWVEATKDNYREVIDRVGGDSQAVYDRMVEGRRIWRALKASEDAGRDGS